MSWDTSQVCRHNGIRNLSPQGHGDGEEEGGRISRIKNVMFYLQTFFVKVYLSELGLGQDIA